MAGSNGRAAGRGQAASDADAGGQGPVELPVHATIPSDFAAGFEIQQRIVEAAAEQGYSADEIFALKIATEEALVNAIKHGNKLDKAKMVRIEASVSPERVQVEIEDEGLGFDRTTIPDPLAEENIEKPSGRGILLIEAYMTEVSWSLGGRRLHMTKRRAATSVSAN